MKTNRRAFEIVGSNTGYGETDLIQDVVRGDEQACQRFFQTHKDRVFSVCLRMTGNYYEAEDLLQETFLRAFRKIAGFRGESSLRTWIHRIAVNVVIESLRRRHPDFQLPEIETAETVPGGLPALHWGVDLTVERLRLERAIAGLPPGYRAVLVLHDVEGYSHEEIAQFLGSQIGTSKSQLHKARRILRKLLGGV